MSANWRRNTAGLKFYAVKYDEGRQVPSGQERGEIPGGRQPAWMLSPEDKPGDLSDDEIWLVYIMLTRVETAFHLLKGEPGLRPFYHWKEDRCDAHVWITVLAYNLLRWIEYSLELAGVDCTYQEVRRLLQTHCCTAISLPCGNGREYHVRRPGKPDERQKMIYSALSIGVGALPVRKVVVEPSPAGET